MINSAASTMKTGWDATRVRLEDYFDRTAFDAWAALTSDAPVSKIRQTVRAGREDMRNMLLSWLPEDLSGRRILDAGCGTGALLCDLAAAVGPGGRVIGVEPQTALAHAASQRLTAAGYEPVSEVRNESAHMLSLETGSAAACLAQTVLIHLPDEMLQEALREMIRVVRPGGRVVSVDQDGDTWVIDHPDRELTRRIVRFNSDQRYADGWTGRRLRRFFRQAGLSDVEVHTRTHVDTAIDSYLYGMALRVAGSAAEAGTISEAERSEWVRQLHELASAGDFFSSITSFACVGTRV